MLSISGRCYDPDLIVFDKDGTLIVFDAVWHRWFAEIMAAIGEQIAISSDLEGGLAGTLGYDPATDVWEPMGPLTLASTTEINILMASQLYRYCDVTWDRALAIVREGEDRARAVLADDQLVQPIGDVPGALRRMSDAGTVLALATTDTRASTERHLQQLGIASLLSATVCADDGIPLKPAPDMALALCERVGVPPHRSLMVGDTVADLEMARRAGFMAAIGVGSGAAPSELLAPYADAVIPDIHAIEIVDCDPHAPNASPGVAIDAPPAYAGYILDLDGTIYLGDRLIIGAREVVLRIREAGKGVVFLSNKPLEPRDSYAAKLTRLGIPTPAEDVINSTRALIGYLRGECPGARVFVIGETALLEELRDEGLFLSEDRDEIEVVVAAFDRTLDYTKLNIAHQALARGARFFATNADRTCPIAGGEIPDCAGVIAFLEATTGRQVEMIAGKPSRLMLDAAVARLGVPGEDCLMVGDRLATDMRMGSDAGIDTALVLTGVTTREDMAGSQVTPTYVLESVAELVKFV